MACADIPFVKPDFGKVKMSKYYRHSAANYKVMGMWTAFYDAYQDKTAEKKAFLPLEKTGARILLIAGGADAAEWSLSRRADAEGGLKIRAQLRPDLQGFGGGQPPTSEGLSH